VPTLKVEGKVVTLGYVIYERGVQSIDQIADMAIAIGCNILWSLCGPAWVPSEVLLAHRRPADTRPYRRFFRASVRFDAGHNVLVFPSRWLAQPLPSTDPLCRCRRFHPGVLPLVRHDAGAVARLASGERLANRDRLFGCRHGCRATTRLVRAAFGRADHADGRRSSASRRSASRATSRC
jgi:hypothetical protein